MRPVFLNLVLALAWAGISGDFSSTNLAIGFVAGYVIIALQWRLLGESAYYGKVIQFLNFTLYFIKEIIVSSLQVAHDVVTVREYNRPGIVAVPLDAKTDLEIALLANVVSLTPGTLSLEVSPDKKTLYVHAMFIQTPEQVRQAIKEGLERRLLEVMR